MIKQLLSKIDSFTHLRLSWALGGALLFQLAGIYLMPIETYGGFVTAALAGSYSLLLLGLAANLRIWGVKVLFIGASLNFLVIAFNGWRMPVTSEVLLKAGFAQEAAFATGVKLPDPKNVLLHKDSINLAFFSDIIPSTKPIHAIWSVGDLLIILGLVLVLIGLARALFRRTEKPESNSFGKASSCGLALKMPALTHQSQVVKVDRLLTEAIKYIGSYRLELARVYGANVQTKIELLDQRALLGDEVLLRSALVNLLINALDAMSEKGGTLAVTSTPQDTMTEILVSDTGEGMSPEIQARIFEPFFSGKGKGHTGIGLTVVKHVISAHGGQISFRSQPEKGSTFSIILPAAEQP